MPARPKGRAPKGTEWDSTKGVWRSTTKTVIIKTSAGARGARGTESPAPGGARCSATDSFGGRDRGPRHSQGMMIAMSTAAVVLFAFLGGAQAQQASPDDSCRYAKDGDCDEPQYCDSGTDCSDIDSSGNDQKPLLTAPAWFVAQSLHQRRARPWEFLLLLWRVFMFPFLRRPKVGCFC